MKPTRYYIWPFAIAIVIFAASSQSSLATPNVGFSYDKIVHFLIFGLLATSLIRIPQLLKKSWKGVLLTILIVAIYGVTDELHQIFTVNRSIELNDWIADTSGAIVASTVYFKWAWYRSILERRFFTKKNQPSPAS